MTPAVWLLVDEPLRLFLPVRHRSGDIELRPGSSSLGHLVQSVGVPLTEVGRLLRVRTGSHDPVEPSYRPCAGDVVRVTVADRPQPLPASGARFVLDVHLGSLARRMRLLGLDAWYATDIGDRELVEHSLAEDRILLTKDRGILRRRALRHAAYVRGTHADEQVADVLDRFAPALAPLTRCPGCNGELRPVAKTDVATVLEPGTARSYEEFSQCIACARVYWRGAHARRIDDMLGAAQVRTTGPAD